MVLLIGWNFVPSVKSDNPASDEPVYINDGVQTINIGVKAGYSPNHIEAKAGVPTVINFKTSSTFDCSSVLVIPKLGYQKTLPNTGTEKVTLSAAQASGDLGGQCGMGMYNFDITFN